MTGTETDSWVTRELGIGLLAQPSNTGYTADQLVAPALRRNPRRAHLLVSTVLGKHLPTPPAVVLAAADRLGDQVAEALGDATENATVLGFAETATGLGHCVAARMGAGLYLHSTRRRVPGARVWARFEEGHSHATSHMMMPSSGRLLTGDGPLVLVDDEFSTGATAVAAIQALAIQTGMIKAGMIQSGPDPRRRHVVASLVDVRTDAHRATMRAAAAELGTRIDSVSLARGRISLPDGVIDRICGFPDPSFNPCSHRRGTVSRVDLSWPASVPDGGRHGFLAADTAPFAAAVERAAAELAGHVNSSRPVIVIGHEELMYLPLRLAQALADGGADVLFQTTTRSPAYVLDEPGYPLKRGFRFRPPESDESAWRYLYNARWPDADAQIVLVVDAPADTARLRGAGGLVDALAAAGEDVVVAVVAGADPGALARMRELRR